MNIKSYYTIRFIISFIWTVGVIGACGTSAGNNSNNIPTDSSSPPSFIIEELNKSFPDWRVKRAGDLDSGHQDLWAKANPSESPGNVAGRFQDNKTTGYVLLLVPAKGDRKDYLVVLFSKFSNGLELKSFQIAAEKNQVLERVVIKKIPKGTYFGNDDETKIKLKYDGIQVEDLEVGSVIYYWSNGLFKRVIEAD